MLRQKREKSGTGICHVMQGRNQKPVPPIPYIQNDQVAKAKEYATKLLEVKPDDDTAKQIMAL